jgi:NADPH:quinone reductase-like Zn-dependent oxidoreductase
MRVKFAHDGGEETMQALTLNGYDGTASLALKDVPAPEPRASDVLIAVRAASVNPVDGKIAQGYARARMELKFPHVLGRDCSGVVAGVGRDVTGLAVGDEVYGVADQTRSGTHAQFVAIDAANVGRKPRNIDHAAAASLPVAALSALAGIVTTGNVSKGQKVLIHAGAGGVGSIAIQIARHLGAFVATTAGPANADFVRGLGADLVIDYTSTDFAAAIKDYDLVFDLMGGDVRYRSFAVLKPGGVITHISVPPMTQPPPRSDVTVKPAPVSYERRFLEQIAAWVDDGVVKPVVSSVAPLADAIKAYEQVMTGHARGKVVLAMPGE